MKLSNFIMPCRNGRVVKNHGRSVFASCGHCPDCMNRKGVRLSQLCQNEASDNKFVYWFTLTYNDECIPKCALIDQGNYIQCVDRTTRPYRRRDRHGNRRYKPSSDYGRTIANIPGTSFSDPLFNKFFNKATTSFKDGKSNYFHDQKVLRYCRKKDLQNFFKRLRHYISELYDIPVTFFAAAEYGPRTFRPHYHVILYFNDGRLCTDLAKIVNKSWKYGDVRRLESTKDSNSTGKYVAEYTNSFSRLPRFLSVDGLRPFSSHSLYFGRSYSELVREEIYTVPERAFGLHVYQTPSGLAAYKPDSFHQTLLFPRCYNYEYQSYYELRKLYMCYFRLRVKSLQFLDSRSYGHYVLWPLSYRPRVVDFTRLILNNPHDPYFHSLLLALNIFTDGDNYHSDADEYHDWLYLDPSYKFTTYTSAKEHHLLLPPVRGKLRTYASVFSRVYSAVSLSKHFCEFCCDHRDPDDVLELIRFYYRRIGYLRLTQQLEMEQQFEHEVFDTEDYSLFFPSVNEELNDELNTDHPWYKNVLLDRDREYNDKVKHKELNDENGIFL